jgi:hypothetical protein
MIPSYEVELSVKTTVKGSDPPVGVAVKSATGALLTPVTVIETVAVLLSTVPSFALKVKLSAPL